MGMLAGLPIVDTMIGFPHEGFAQYDFIRKQTKDRNSKEEMEFPAEYMFKDVPKDLPTDDPISVTLHEMDKYGIEIGLIGVSRRDVAPGAEAAPDRFVPSGDIPDPNDVTGSVRKLRQEYEEFGIKAPACSPRAPSRRWPSTTQRCTRSTRPASTSTSPSSAPPAFPARG